MLRMEIGFEITDKFDLATDNVDCAPGILLKKFHQSQESLLFHPRMNFPGIEIKTLWGALEQHRQVEQKMSNAYADYEKNYLQRLQIPNIPYIKRKGRKAQTLECLLFIFSWANYNAKTRKIIGNFDASRSNNIAKAFWKNKITVKNRAFRQIRQKQHMIEHSSMI
uniref:Uncharacterized protein n=1 Tax=Romanomermis culicivorax TaxID=13658 RepID=A0A915I7A6_ROMCU